MRFFNASVGYIKILPLNKNSENDFKFFKKVFSNRDVMSTVSLYDGGTPNNVNLIRDFKSRSITHDKYNLGSYKLTNDSNKVMGITSLLLIKKNDKNQPTILEFEYFIMPKFQFKKIGTDVAKFLINYAFKNFKTVRKIYATALINNIPSQIIMHRLGFKYAGKRKRKKGGVVNLRYITPFRFYLSKFKIVKLKAKYLVKKIQKLNNKKQIKIEEYSLYNL